MDITTKRGMRDATSSKRMMAENKREIPCDAYVKRTWWWPKRRLFYYRDPDTGEIDATRFLEKPTKDSRSFAVVGSYLKNE